MLGNLDFYHLRFHLKAKEPFTLGSFPGDILRGRLGETLRGLVCMDRDLECRACPLEGRCLYSRLFNPRNLSGNGLLGQGEPLPRPFVMRTADAGLSLLDMTLVGKDKNEYLPYLVFAVNAMGRNGLQRGAGRFRIQRVDALDGGGNSSTIYEDGALSIRGAPSITMAELDAIFGTQTTGSLTLHFLTPLRLKAYNGLESRLVHRPSFHQIIKALLWRADLLHIYHCGGQTDYDYAGLAEAARSIRSLEHNPVYWQPLTRYSHVMDARMNLDGFMGSMTFEGPGMSRFIPLLKLGEYVHIGKATTFGHGAILAVPA